MSSPLYRTKVVPIARAAEAAGVHIVSALAADDIATVSALRRMATEMIYGMFNYEDDDSPDEIVDSAVVAAIESHEDAEALVDRWAQFIAD